MRSGGKKHRAALHRNSTTLRDIFAAEHKKGRCNIGIVRDCACEKAYFDVEEQIICCSMIDKAPMAADGTVADE